MIKTPSVSDAPRDSIDSCGEKHLGSVGLATRETMKRLLLLIWMLLGVSCGATPQPTPISIPLASTPRAVIVDTDMAPDDMLALLYLLARPDVNLRAITISGTGITRCAAGIKNARAILEAMERATIPVACGRETPLQGNHAFPNAWRDAMENFSSLESSNTNVPNENAVDLITRVVEASNAPVTILTLGPLTNLADAFAQNPSLTRKIEMVYSMGGAVNVAGNVSNHNAAEWNFYIDPLAAQQVLASDAPLTLVPLDATNRVPVTRAFLEKLNTQQTTRAAQLAKKFLDTQRGEIENGAYYFWDPLAAVIVTNDAVATFETQKIAVATNDADSGRVALTEDGAVVRVAVDADPARFEATFLQTLNGQFK